MKIVNLQLLFQIAGLGVLLMVIMAVLKEAKNEEIGKMAVLAGIVMVLVVVVKLLGDLFQEVKSVFMLY
ncbi:MAG: stage III sporulation protein AC [Bacillota bacterium]|uniref:Stage III sporulation protein AC n=2 Tax=Carboxydocella TaxID=178898 RepID=A0A1T4SAA6_9FIRM|nr:MULTISPECIES: stage III sporulation protein AC [Carboxydocella]AVX20134.1 stage III sporulation protein AC [Carboxydocella thermautotrophica]AVX30553.1 stage III sporulation protein AC [Carboxydocella thermautotrophica]SKA24808.1 stage III sporulation protein AC [Carboxydocella sporoproducens DSM 16521]GAW28450.1 stage III sporulation protein AC [Carboxydocella sp. ULO1]GAW31773.1 stage III sporulation protein AC [Carboxydocella sp. JDF658]